MNCIKLKHIALLLLFIAFRFSSFSQITGGGVYNDNTQNRNNKKNKDDVFKNSMILTVSPTQAIGKYSNDVKNLSDFKKGYGGMSGGLSVLVGRIYYLNGIDVKQIGLTDDFKIGIDATFFNYSYSKGENYISYNYALFTSCGLGGVISYNPADKLIIDLKLSLEPSVMSYGLENEYYDFNSLVVESFEGSGFGIRTGLGAYIRYRPLIFGIKANWGNINLNAYHYETKEIEVYDPYYGYYYTDYEYKSTKINNVKTSTTRVDFILGFAF